MDVEKCELCSSLWASWDELHCGMDARQCTEYFLQQQFVKYESDRLAGQPYAAIMNFFLVPASRRALD